MKFTEACSFIKKETLAQVFSCEFYEISKNTFHRTPLDDCFFIMNYQSSSFEGEGNWNENLWKGLEVEISLKI